MNAVEELLRRAYRDMDRSTGMFPEGWTCIKCGKVLNADGNHPAELYAGTYTGLCYGCERSGPYPVRVSLLDGAVTMSHPPHCPSWRRDRGEFWAYPDCGFCNGSGRETCYRPFQTGGSYPIQCKLCAQRRDGHPFRIWWWARRDLIDNASQARFERRLREGLRKAGVKAAAMRSRKGFTAAAVEHAEVVEAVRAEVLAVNRRLLNRHNARSEQWAKPLELVNALCGLPLEEAA